MLRKIVTFLILAPLVILFLGFAVANRQIVTVSFDPFDSTMPAYAASLPLFILIFVLLTLGVIVGGAAAWFRQSKWRRTARRLDAENRELMQTIADMRQRTTVYAPERPVDRPAPLVIPPPVP